MEEPDWNKAAHISWPGCGRWCGLEGLEEPYSRTLCWKFKTKRWLTKCSSVNAPLPLPGHITFTFKALAVIRSTNSTIFDLDQVSQTWCHQHKQTGWFRYGLHMWVVCWLERVTVVLNGLGCIVLRWWLHTENVHRIIMYLIPALQEWRFYNYIYILI